MNNLPQKRYPACILATCCIPWDERGGFAADQFRDLVRTLLKNLTRDLYLFGTAGEGYAVNETQFDQIIKVFSEESVRPGVRPMVGIISLSLSTIVERIERARDLDFRNFQISFPSWGALTDPELRAFFQETCGRFPDCNFLHYNLARARRVLMPEEYAALADRHPNLVATKNGGYSVAQCLALAAKAPQLQHFFTESTFGHVSMTEPCSLLISVASINFAAARRYFEAGQNGDLASLQKMQSELDSLTRELVAIGLPDGHMDGAFDKVFCKLQNPDFPLRLLPPYSGLKQETFERIAAMIRDKYPTWHPSPDTEETVNN